MTTGKGGDYSLWLDTETRSELPINVGTFAYAASCEPDILSWSVDGAPVERVDFQTCSQGDISMVRDLIHEARLLIAHNAMFDRTVLALGSLKIATPREKWRCTMVRAMAHALPGSLGKLCELLGVSSDKSKMKEGHALMMLFCKPRPKNSILRWATAETHPEERARYLDYCDLDVIAMLEVAKRLPVWNMAHDYPAPGEPWLPGHTELAHWHRDQAMNDRGYLIDIPFVHDALRAVKAEQARLKVRTQDATNGRVESATQRDAFLEHVLLEYGIPLTDLKKGTLERIIADADIDDGLRELLCLRLETCTTSTAKYTSLAKGASADGRLRGTIQMNGAGKTQRASGRLFQPQNLPSRGLLPADEIEIGIRAMSLGAEHHLFSNVMHLASSAIRGAIIAPPGRKLVVADLSNIEGRVLAWMAGEDWLIQAFRDYDSGVGHDLYKLEYCRVFGGDPALVTKDQRQLGKVITLFGGYQGSVGAFMTFALAYGINLDDMADKALPTLSQEAIAQAEELLAWFIQKKIHLPGLRHQTIVAILCIVYGWRAAHPATVALWKGMENTAKLAVSNPGETFVYGRCKFRRQGAWTRIQRPSGRVLCYPGMRVEDDGKLSFDGLDQYTRQWKRLRTYGGRLTENLIQATSRDILYDAQPRIEAAGYEICLHVHDENITEVPDLPEYNAKELAKLMTAPPAWLPGGESYAPDLPLAAAGFETYRYHKE